MRKYNRPSVPQIYAAILKYVYNGVYYFCTSALHCLADIALKDFYSRIKFIFSFPQPRSKNKNPCQVSMSEMTLAQPRLGLTATKNVVKRD